MDFKRIDLKDLSFQDLLVLNGYIMANKQSECLQTKIVNTFHSLKVMEGSKMIWILIEYIEKIATILVGIFKTSCLPVDFV